MFRIAVVAALLLVCCVSFAEQSTKSGKNIHPELALHTKHFDKKIYRVGDNVYSAVGWNVSNIVMIEGDDGIILVDAGLNPETSAAVLAEFRKITTKPIVAIFYIHFHHDHIGGVKGLVTEDQVASGQVSIYAHSTLMHSLATESNLLGPVLGVRAGYTFGFHLESEDRQAMNAGIGPLPTGGKPVSFIAPTHVIEDRLSLTISGVDIEVLHVPSEAPDELVIYLPESRALIDTEVIQGPTFPNMHTLRGAQFRDPVQWVTSIDRLRELSAEYLVPSHGQPVYGAEKSEEVLRMTRDAIQYVHDQTIRYMNRGLTPDELVQAVKLPPHLHSYSPYLRQYYGTVKHAVRQIYTGYLGWFEGDPVALDPVPRKEGARRLVKMMGGRDSVLQAARDAFSDGDDQWAAELATYLIRIDTNDQAARDVKAGALRSLAYGSMNINWRNWYLSSAMELEGAGHDLADPAKMAKVFSPPDIVASIPVATSLAAWSTRLKAEETLSVNMTLGFRFTDRDQEFALTVRRGVAEFSKRIPSTANAVLSLTKPQLDNLVLQKTTIEQEVTHGRLKLDGSLDEVVEFLGYFEQLGEQPIALTLR